MPSRTRAAFFIQVFIGLLVLCTGREAFALTAVAGMCDPIGASAPAPMPVLPIRGGEIIALDDCDRLLAAFGEGEPPTDAASHEVIESAPKPPLPAGFVIFERVGEVLPVPVLDRARPPTRTIAGIYRPPRG